MESLSEKWEKFSLSEHKGNKFHMEEGEPVQDYFLAARFFTSRVLNMEAIANTFKLLWRTRKGFKVGDVGNHRVLFKFRDTLDIDRVLRGEPWSFDKFLVALKRVSRNTDVKNLIFDRTQFWLQVHNLPIGSFSLSVAKAVASVAGEVVESELGDGKREGCNFIRVRVTVKLPEPLCRGRQIVRSGGIESWVDFKYKHLPNLCYWCGRLTHHDKDCPTRLKKRGANRDEEKQFGSWLRASTPNPLR